VADYDLIALEDLHITNMTRSARGTVESPGSNVAAKAGLNRSILDAGWGQLVRMVSYKAESAGRTIVRVAAPHTSQTCARCGHTDPASRVTRDHFACTNPACRHTAHADANAAEVVLAVATGRLTIQAPRPRRRRTRPGSGHPPATAGRDAA
jgi:putative transposase